jgi:hypothetical protein
MDPEHDALNIWETARDAGIEKYRQGQREHGAGFWTAGASWYLDNACEESIDLIAYLHHLRSRIREVRAIAALLYEGEVTSKVAASAIESLLSSRPPRKQPDQSSD